MIALQDDFNQSKVGRRLGKLHSRGRMRALLQKISTSQAIRKQRKSDRLAINQLLQLDDVLLKDMGLDRNVLLDVRRGALSFDALIKQDINTTRDNGNYCAPMSNKPPPI